MAPSTGVSFIITGLVLLRLRRPIRSITIWWVSCIATILVMLFGFLEVPGHFTGLDLNLEDALIPSAGKLGEIPVGRMSPATGFAFFLTSLSVLGLLLRTHWSDHISRLGQLGGVLGSVVIVTSATFCGAYLLGSPLLYGRGVTIPMALTTALAFFAVGLAVIGAAGARSFPLSLFARLGVIMDNISARRQFMILICIMIAACGLVLAVMTTMLYRSHLDETRNRLSVTVKSNARLIEAVARHEVALSEKLAGHPLQFDPVRSTLNQFVDGHQKLESTGDTEEFTLARRLGDSIDFVLRRRQNLLNFPQSVPFDGSLAEPMRRALRGNSGTCIAADYRGNTVVAAYEPVEIMDLAIVAKIDLAEVRAPIIRSGLMAGGASVLIVILGALLFLRISRPLVTRLEVHAAELEQEIQERERTEAEREKLQALLNHSQKMESVGRLAGGVAHDFNNMLSVILGYAELSLDEVDPDDPRSDWIGEIKSAAIRSSILTRQLLAFARRETVSPQILDLNAAVAGTLTLLERLIGEDIDLIWVPKPGLWSVMIDPGQIDQMLANLCVNARDAIDRESTRDGPGVIRIETRNRTLSEFDCVSQPELRPGEFVEICVLDNGTGIAPELLPHVFDPFFTTKGVGEGTGLGLATLYGVVKQNKGFVRIDSDAGKGTCLEIYLPRHEGEPSPSTEDNEMVVLGEESLTILVVEDEAAILSLVTSMLTRLRYRVLEASSPMQAIHIAKEHEGEIHLLLSDVVMPEMNGLELSKKIEALHPNLAILFMSGYTADVIANHGVLDQGTHLLSKPFTIQNLSVKVHQTIGVNRITPA